MTTAKKANYGKDFITPLVEVHWSSLASPDTKFGNPNHSITVLVTENLNNLLQAAVQALGGKKINGLREYEGKKLMKFKSTLAVKEGLEAYPITGADLTPSSTIPYRPDLVRVKVSPVLIERDSSVSFYMGEVQLVERRWTPTEGASAFTKVDA